MTATYYASAGARLAFTSTGAGIPVVFLHPTPLDGDYWRPMVADLAGIRAIVPDLRGHGRSELGGPLPAGGFPRVPNAPVLPMARYATDVLTLLDHLQIQSAFFAGCSIGGYILLELWRRAPERISGLAFICSKPQPDAEAILIKRAATIASIRSHGVDAIFDVMAHTLLGPSSRNRHPKLIAEVRARMTLTAQAFIAVQAGLAVRPDSVPTVATIDAPILAISAGEDSAVTPAEMEAFCAAPGGCESHFLPDAGHFAACEQPGKIASLLAEWLRNHAG